MAELHTQGLRWTTFLFSLVGLKCSWLYNILDAHANSHSHLFFIQLPTYCTQTHLLLACHLHNACDHASFYLATHTIYMVFLSRTPASCLLLVPGAFPVIFVLCQTTANASTDVKEKLQVNIQHLNPFLHHRQVKILNELSHNGNTGDVLIFILHNQKYHR